MRKISHKVLFSLLLFCPVFLIATPVQEGEASPLITPPALGLSAESDSFLMEFLRMMSVLGLIIVGLIFLSWYLRRLMSSRLEQMNASSVIKVVERRDLNPKTVLYIVEVHEQQFLVAETPQGVSSLGELRSRKPFADSKSYGG